MLVAMFRSRLDWIAVLYEMLKPRRLVMRHRILGHLVIMEKYGLMID